MRVFFPNFIKNKVFSNDEKADLLFCRYNMRMACYVVKVEHYLKLKWQKEKKIEMARRGCHLVLMNFTPFHAL